MNGHDMLMSSDFFGQPLGMVWYTVKISSKISNPIIYSALPIRACQGTVCVGETLLDGEVGH